MKIYKDSKELPFLIYKKIIQTGDFLYMIKGYEDGNEVESDTEKLSVLQNQLEEKFNDLITDFVFTANTVSQEVNDQVNYSIALLEFNKLSSAYNIINHLNEANKTLGIHGLSDHEEIKAMIDEVLEGIKVERNSDFDILLQRLNEKISVFESNIMKYEELIKNSENKDEKQDVDLDKQFINICLALEIPFPDESKISLYQFSILIEKAVERSKALEKINSKS